MNTQQSFQKLIRKRRSCRQFNNTKIDNNTIKAILSDCQYCPSSFGLEPWKILVVKNHNLKQKLQTYCDNQKQVGKSSHLVIILSYNKKMLAKTSPWMEKQLKIKKSFTTQEQYYTFYDKRFVTHMNKFSDWDNWSIHQGYILLQMLLLSATSYNIATSPMEGIDGTSLVSFLEKQNIIKEKGSFNCSLVVAMGYPDEKFEHKEKQINKEELNYEIIE